MTEKELLEQQHSLIKEMREETEKKNNENQTKVKNISDKLDKLETDNQDLVKAQQEKDKKYEELQENIKSMETKFARFPSGTRGSDKSDSIKAYEKLIMYGEKTFSLDEIKYLRTDSNVEGGVLDKPEIIREILKKITELSRIRQVARVMETDHSRVEIFPRTNLSNAFWDGQGTDIQESQSSYGKEVVEVRRLSVLTISTWENLMNPFFNIEQEINDDATERFAAVEGLAFVQGDGINEPQGFMINPDIQIINSGNASALTADSLIEITGEIKTGYNPTYLLNRRTIAKIRTLKGGDGHYLWQPGLAAGLPNTINGDPYVETPDMDDIATGSFPVAYGDFRKGYLIVDRMVMRVLRDDFSVASQGKIRFIFSKFTGGKVVLPEAIKKIKIAS